MKGEESEAALIFNHIKRLSQAVRFIFRSLYSQNGNQRYPFRGGGGGVSGPQIRLDMVAVAAKRRISVLVAVEFPSLFIHLVVQLNELFHLLIEPERSTTPPVSSM
jgi:hypothetical protein